MGGRRLWAAIPIALLMAVGSVAWAEPVDDPIDATGYLPINLAGPTSETVIVAEGDHLWVISERHLTTSMEHVPSDTEVAPYWVEVIEANRDRLRSGHPDLIYPGETVVLP